MNFGSVLIILLGATTLVWFVWLGYTDHRRLRQLFGAGRSKATSVDDTTTAATADEPRPRV